MVVKRGQIVVVKRGQIVVVKRGQIVVVSSRVTRRSAADAAAAARAASSKVRPSSGQIKEVESGQNAGAEVAHGWRDMAQSSRMTSVQQSRCGRAGAAWPV